MAKAAKAPKNNKGAGSEEFGGTQSIVAPVFNEDEHTALLRKPVNGAVLNVYTDKEKTQAFFWLEPSAPFFKLSEDDITAALGEGALKLTPDIKDRIVGLFRTHRGNARLGLFTDALFRPQFIAHAKPAKPGTDARIEWLIENPDPSNLRLIEGVDGRVDYREMHRVINVSQNMGLAVMHPPVPGEAGEDLFGKPIEPKLPKEISLGSGNGTRFEESDKTYYAEIDGRATIRDGNVVVEPVYVVEGDVDLSVGNIEFRGNVEVKNDLLEGFTIKASGDVLIGGFLSDGNIFCDGNVTIVGGVTGKPSTDQHRQNGLIETKGNINAKYMLNGNAHALGDMIVASQIINSEVACAGRLVMPQGTLIGGTTLALGGVEVAVIGADLGTRTELSITVDEFSTRETRSIDHEIQVRESEIVKIRKTVTDYLDDPNKIKTISGKRKEEVLAKVRKLKASIEEIKNLNDERAAILEPLKKRAKEEIIVHKRLFPGVDIRINKCRLSLAREMAGPVRLVPNYERGTLMITAFKP